ncbi:GNAT family N-acetyltransferase [Microvirga roseola]|uniref:GNAT family N-acetyltransferase n=1 Tax=Microvirga roseola TaxID=2883126 RepID=UPI001E5E01A1|nr:N-acetyltransferase [Microvirga roseola]
MDDPGACRRFKATIEVLVRPCLERDLPALEWMGLYTRQRDIIREAFNAQERGDALLLLGVSAGFPVGQVWIDFARKRAEGIAYLWAVRTFYPLQGSGIGRHMMDAAEAALRERGIVRAELGVERDNDSALRFYEKLGWRVVGPLQERFSYRSDGSEAAIEHLDQWLMAKPIL